AAGRHGDGFGHLPPVLKPGAAVLHVLRRDHQHQLAHRPGGGARPERPQNNGVAQERDVLFGPARLPHAAAVPGGGNDDRGCVVDVRLETHLFTIRASRPNTCRGPRRHAWPRAAAPRPAVPAGPPRPPAPAYSARSMGLGLAKIMRPAAVCSTLVTMTPTDSPMKRRPPSTTIMVPSSR